MVMIHNFVFDWKKQTRLKICFLTGCTYIELRVEDDEFGTGGYQVVTLVCPHELAVHLVFVLICNTGQTHIVKQALQIVSE